MAYNPARLHSHLAMPNRHAVENALAASWPPEDWQDLTVAVAVSGGADSVALLRGLVALKTGGEGRLAVAHLNHGLRGREAEADEAFVVDLCRRLDVSCHIGGARVAEVAAGRGDGLEEAARVARYRFLAETASQIGARYVATAHTADDQAETILHRILRGTGIAGLAGMPRARAIEGCGASLIRPLLGVHRSELVAYLTDLGQPYREDTSNRDPKHTRNRLRHDLLPTLARDYNPGVADALLRLGRLAGEVQSVIDALAADLAERCLARQTPQTLEIDRAALADQPCYLVREVLVQLWGNQRWPLQSMGFAEWEELAEMATAVAPQTAKRTFPGGVSAEVRANGLTLKLDE